jgi:hypothetical protein
LTGNTRNALDIFCLNRIIFDPAMEFAGYLVAAPVVVPMVEAVCGNWTGIDERSL